MGQIQLPLDSFNSPDGLFRPIHYLGSKLRILDFISDAVDKANPSNEPICDLFAGSGTVSYMFSRKRSVTAVDIQEYSRVICEALMTERTFPYNINDLLSNWEDSETSNSLMRIFEPLIVYEESCFERARVGNLFPISELLEIGPLVNTFNTGHKNPTLQEIIIETKRRLDIFLKREEAEAITTLLYGGVYFSFKQTVALDVLSNKIKSLDNVYRDKFHAALLSTASDIVNTIGKQFAQPIRPRDKDGNPKKNLFSIVNRDRGKDVFNVYKKWVLKYFEVTRPEHECRVLKLDYAEAFDKLPKDTKVIYADPPYTRDHYSRFYHVLETLALGDQPALTLSKKNGEISMSRGAYRRDRHQSPFCIKTKVVGAFEVLFANARHINSNLIVSYSPYDINKNVRPRLLTIDQLISIGKRYYPNIQVVTTGKFSHNKLNTNERKLEASTDSEVLLVCQIS